MRRKGHRRRDELCLCRTPKSANTSPLRENCTKASVPRIPQRLLSRPKAASVSASRAYGRKPGSNKRRSSPSNSKSCPPTCRKGHRKRDVFRLWRSPRSANTSPLRGNCTRASVPRIPQRPLLRPRVAPVSASRAYGRKPGSNKRRSSPSNSKSCPPMRRKGRRKRDEFRLCRSPRSANTSPLRGEGQKGGRSLKPEETVMGAQGRRRYRRVGRMGESRAPTSAALRPQIVSRARRCAGKGGGSGTGFVCAGLRGLPIPARFGRTARKRQFLASRRDRYCGRRLRRYRRVGRMAESRAPTSSALRPQIVSRARRCAGKGIGSGACFVCAGLRGLPIPARFGGTARKRQFLASRRDRYRGRRLRRYRRGGRMSESRPPTSASFPPQIVSRARRCAGKGGGSGTGFVCAAFRSLPIPARFGGTASQRQFLASRRDRYRGRRLRRYRRVGRMTESRAPTSAALRPQIVSRARRCAGKGIGGGTCFVCAAFRSLPIPALFGRTARKRQFLASRRDRYRGRSRRRYRRVGIGESGVCPKAGLQQAPLFAL